MRFSTLITWLLIMPALCVAQSPELDNWRNLEPEEHARVIVAALEFFAAGDGEIRAGACPWGPSLDLDSDCERGPYRSDGHRLLESVRDGVVFILIDDPYRRRIYPDYDTAERGGRSTAAVLQQLGDRMDIRTASVESLRQGGYDAPSPGMEVRDVEGERLAECLPTRSQRPGHLGCELASGVSALIFATYPVAGPHFAEVDVTIYRDHRREGEPASPYSRRIRLIQDEAGVWKVFWEGLPSMRH